MNARIRDLLYLALDYIADTPIRKSLYPLWKLFLELEESSVHKFWTYIQNLWMHIQYFWTDIQRRWTYIQRRRTEIQRRWTKYSIRYRNNFL